MKMNMSTNYPGGKNDNGRTRVRRGLAVLAAASAGVLASAVPAGEGPWEPLTAVVSYADLDLDRQAGAQALYRRLRFAARHVCKPFARGALKHAVERRACMDEAIERAVRDIDVPVLSAYHLAQISKPAKPAIIARE